nr:MAG TPA: hypothetical protein [Caudoviricetes sp.]
MNAPHVLVVRMWGIVKRILQGIERQLVRK